MLSARASRAAVVDRHRSSQGSAELEPLEVVVAPHGSLSWAGGCHSPGGKPPSAFSPRPSRLLLVPHLLQEVCWSVAGWMLRTRQASGPELLAQRCLAYGRKRAVPALVSLAPTHIVWICTGRCQRPAPTAAQKRSVVAWVGGNGRRCPLFLASPARRTRCSRSIRCAQQPRYHSSR